MTTRYKIKSLLTVALLISLSSYAEDGPTKSTERKNSLAPEASAAEAKLSFWDIPILDKGFINPSPADRKDGLAVGELGINSGNKAMLLQLAKEVGEQKYGSVDSLLVAQQGKLILESYYLRGRVNLYHDLASSAKGVTSLVLGRAIQMGYLTMADLDKPLVSFLKDLDPTKFVDGAEKITLHKALIMHGGLQISDEQKEEFDKNPSKLKGQGQVQTLLEISAPISSESQHYLYGNYNPTMVMQVIEAVVPGTAEGFIKTELLDKMDITNYLWETAVSGLPEAGWRVSMTSRDMLKWGILLASKGKWQGEQLISAEYLAKATSGITKPAEDWMPDAYSYGYFFYQTKVKVEDKSYDAGFAWGGFGQYIIAIDELELAVAITAHERDDKIFTQISEKIVAAFVK